LYWDFSLIGNAFSILRGEYRKIIATPSVKKPNSHIDLADMSHQPCKNHTPKIYYGIWM